MDILSSINNGSVVHYTYHEGLQYKVMQEEFLKKQGKLKSQKQDSSTSADSEKSLKNFVWTDHHNNKFEELMTKNEDSSIDTIQKKFNRYLNGNSQLQKNIVFNIEKPTLEIIWKDIQLRNKLLSDDRKQEHRYKMRIWMEEERELALAKVAKERERIVAEADKLMNIFKKKFKK